MKDVSAPQKVLSIDRAGNDTEAEAFYDNEVLFTETDDFSLIQKRTIRFAARMA